LDGSSWKPFSLLILGTINAEFTNAK